MFADVCYLLELLLLAHLFDLTSAMQPRQNASSDGHISCFTASGS